MPKAKTEGARLLSKPEKANDKDSVEIEKPYMDQLKIYKRQVRYPKRKLPTFCTVKIPTQSIVKQHDLSNDYQHLISESVRSGVSIMLLWTNYRTLIME